MNKLAFAFAGVLSLVTLTAPVEAFARGHGGHHAGFHRGGGGHHHGGFHGFHRHHGGFRWQRHVGPRFVGGPAYGWRRPRRIFVGGPIYRSYPAYAPAYSFEPGCSVRRSATFVPGGWRKIVTVRTCYVR